jgi:WD40 repeat protein
MMSVSAVETAKFWDVAVGNVVKSIRIAEKPSVSDMQMSCGWVDKYAFTISLSGAINVIDVEKGEVSQVYHGHSTSINALAVDRKAGAIYTADQSGKITRWNSQTGHGVWLTGKGHNKNIQSIAVNSDGAVVSVGYDDMLRINDSKAFAESGCKLDGQPTAVAVGNKNANLSVVVLNKGKVQVLRGENVVAEADLKAAGCSVAINTDDTEICVGLKNKTAVLFSLDGDSLKEGKTLSHSGEVVLASYSPDGTWLFTIDSNQKIHCWDSERQNLNKAGWKKHNGRTRACAWSPDGKKFATGSADYSIHVWDKFENWYVTKPATVLERAHIDGVSGLAWLDNDTLVSCGRDMFVKVWKC